MKLLSPRTLSLSSSSSLTFFLYKVQFSHFSSSSHSYSRSSSPSSSFPSYSSRKHDEESRNVRVYVWWDFENCSLPTGTNVFKVSQSITAAIRANGIKGPIQITAFGDVLQLSRANQEALSATGVILSHIPNAGRAGGKNSADRSLLVDLMYWVSQNPPPAHLFLISGDRDFASILHRLRMNNYNILLASPETAPGVLCSAASIMWHWSTLVRGENLTGKHFNQPPDGPYGSWYGHFKAPIEDPFIVVNQEACPKSEELPEQASDSKPFPVPKTVVKQIHNILNTYPKGLSITELRAELIRSGIYVDKDFYGYKKFSRFLLSMPHVLKLCTKADGQFFVFSATPKAPEPNESNLDMAAVPVTMPKDKDLSTSPDSEVKDCSVNQFVTPPVPVTTPKDQNINISPESKVKDCSFNRSVTPAVPLTTKDQDLTISPGSKFKDSSLNGFVTPLHEPAGAELHLRGKEVSAAQSEGQSASLEKPDSATKMGFFRRISRKWFAKDGGTNRTSDSFQEERNCSDVSEKTQHGKKTEESRVEPSNPPGVASDALSKHESAKKISMSSEACSDKLNAPQGFFKHFMNRCRILINGNPDSLSDQSTEIVKQIDNLGQKHHLFTQDAFWSGMESFLKTNKGSGLVFQSKTREQLAQNLKKDGPLVLRSVGKVDLLHLVELLISEKKWIEEYPSQISPFKLIVPAAAKSSSVDHLSGSNGLSSIFSNTLPKSHSLRNPDNREVRQCQDLSYSGISPVIDKRKSRDEVIADCQQLVAEILKEHPEGFNLGSFRKAFLDKYGYFLELQPLGYTKLAALLQLMPGVKVESTYIFPSLETSKEYRPDVAAPDKATYAGTSSDCELSDASRKEDDNDSPWEELGPVAMSSASKTERVSGVNKKGKEMVTERKDLDYEFSLSDEDFTDSEDETPPSGKSEGQRKPGGNSSNSSLIQLLDSWHSSKADSHKKDMSHNMSDTFGIGNKRESHAINGGGKHRPMKTFSFVKDDKDRLIDGILGTLKRPSESKMEY
ncbi:OST-HTH associated domain [Dillenia turbinata]|uniref:OST-HTH associated domain n=1 Tax=Dillenia turbinata TaxID=194707 RepID=A0AAN8Z700_9MAGN